MISKSLSFLPLVILGTLSLAHVDAATAHKCRALCLSGGANKGVYEAGLLYGLAHSDKAEDYFYDVVTGVSAGAINAGAVAVWPKEDTVKMTEWLGDLWKGIKTSDVYEPWTLGWVSGLTTQKGLYNNFNLK